MKDDLKDILSNFNKDIEQEKLLQYLNRELPAEEQYAFEKQMNDDQFMNDAVEGLQQLDNNQDISKHVLQLNKDLKKQLGKKNKKKNKRNLPSQTFTYVGVIIILIIIVVAYIILKKII